MGKINLLSSDVYNKISAGEVVERPCSAIKEILDNAIDANATRISISVEDGGTKSIVICDNGDGIEFDDLQKAFYAHATSKIKVASDIDCINTLGFRGEALASIGAVANVVLKSKTEQNQTGGEIKVDGGVISTPQICVANKGTTIEINNLFFNVPARAKFLKKPKQEENEITNLIARYILIHPNIAFKYSANSKLIYNPNGTGLHDALFIVYGCETVKNLIEVNDCYGGISVRGYIGKPTFIKPNRTYQTISLNNRYITNSTIISAMHNVYGAYLMKRSYPFYVLNLDIDANSVDVNVHPNKMEVRFENNSKIYSCIFHTITSALNNFNSRSAVEYRNIFDTNETLSSNTLQSFSNDIKKNENIIFNNDFEPQLNNHKDEEKTVLSNPQNILPQNNQSPIYKCEIEKKLDKLDNEIYKKEFVLKDVARTSQTTETDCNFGATYFCEKTSTCGDISNNFGDIKQGIIQSDNRGLENLKQQMQAEIELIPAYKIVGQLFNTYILIESKNQMIIIDQHAGHERLLYDKIKQDYANKKIAKQPLLVPYVFNLNVIESQAFLDQVGHLSAIGFDIEDFGSNAFRVVAVPFHLSDINIKDFIDEIISDCTTNKKRDGMIKESLMQKACKSAIKAGKQLNTNEIEFLLTQLKNATVLQCPHGRPITYQVSKNDIEKWFKRIV